MENYKFIADEGELHWFFDHVLKDLTGETRLSYLMCIATRVKKLSEEERKKYEIKGSDGVMMREEIISPRGKAKIWNFDQFKAHIYRYECPKEGMITKAGYPYPEKSLVVLIYAEPSDESRVAQFIANYANTIQFELTESAMNALENGNKEGLRHQLDKFANLTKKAKSCHAENTIKTFIHYDFDVKEDYVSNDLIRGALESDLKMLLSLIYGKGNYFIIKTAGGYHVLVYRSSLEEASERSKNFYGNSDPIGSFLNALTLTDSSTYLTVGEDRIQKQCFVPLPGTIMYGSYVPTIINKEDFE